MPMSVHVDAEWVRAEGSKPAHWVHSLIGAVPSAKGGQGGVGVKSYGGHTRRHVPTRESVRSLRPVSCRWESGCGKT
jgi:hypothetical protein